MKVADVAKFVTSHIIGTCVSINPNEPRQQLALDQLSIGSFNPQYNARNLKEDRGKCSHLQIMNANE